MTRLRDVQEQSDPDVRVHGIPLPPELLYDIVARVVGDQFCDILLLPDYADESDSATSLLHVCTALRSCTIKLVQHIMLQSPLAAKPWDTCGLYDEYRTAVFFTRKLIKLARLFPVQHRDFTEAVAHEKQFKSRKYSPVFNCYGFYIGQVAEENVFRMIASTQRPTKKPECFSVDVVTQFGLNYNIIPSSSRGLLAGRVADVMVERSLAWVRFSWLFVAINQMRPLIDVLENLGGRTSSIAVHDAFVVTMQNIFDDIIQDRSKLWKNYFEVYADVIHQSGMRQVEVAPMTPEELEYVGLTALTEDLGALETRFGAVCGSVGEAIKAFMRNSILESAAILGIYGEPGDNAEMKQLAGTEA